MMPVLPAYVRTLLESEAASSLADLEFLTHLDAAGTAHAVHGGRCTPPDPQPSALGLDDFFAHACPRCFLDVRETGSGRLLEGLVIDLEFILDLELLLADPGADPNERLERYSELITIRDRIRRNAYLVQGTFAPEKARLAAALEVVVRPDFTDDELVALATRAWIQHAKEAPRARLAHAGSCWVLMSFPVDRPSADTVLDSMLLERFGFCRRGANSRERLTQQVLLAPAVVALLLLRRNQTSYAALATVGEPPSSELRETLEVVLTEDLDRSLQEALDIALELL